MGDTEFYVEIGPLETSEDLAANLTPKKDEDHDDDERMDNEDEREMWEMDPPPRPQFPFVLIISLGFLLSILLMLTALGLSLCKNETISTPLIEENLCVTPRCMGVAIRSAMDFLTDPCTDFYKYACGGWNAKDRKGFMATAYMPRIFFVEEENKKLILKILEEPPILSKVKNGVLEKVQKFYKSCMNPSDDTKKRVDQLKDLLGKIGGWSISPSNFTVRNFHFQKLLEILHTNFSTGRNRHGPFFTTLVMPDPEMAEGSDVIHLTSTSIDHDPISDTFSLQPDPDPVVDWTDLNLKAMTKIALSLGSHHDESEILQKKIQSVLNLAEKFANLNNNFAQEKYERLNLTSLQKFCDIVNWKNYFSTIFLDHKVIRPDDTIILHNAHSYFRPLCQLIRDKLVTDESKDELNNYMVWQLVVAMSPFVFDDLRSIQTESDVLACLDERKLFCSQLTILSMPQALSSLYLDERGGQLLKDKMTVEGMLTNVRSEFLDHLDSIGWIKDDPMGRSWAKNKLTNINFLVGYPEFLTDEKKMDTFYEGLVMGDTDFFQNGLKTMAFNQFKMWQRFEQPAMSLWPTSNPITSTETHYLRKRNRVIIPAGILQAPIFRSDFPPVFNFGTLGFILGRQLTHAITNEGKFYDKDGRFGHYWSLEMAQKFNESVECLQNEKYLDPDQDHQDERSTSIVDRIISDLGAIKFAYLAYRKLAQELELDAEPHFPHLSQLDHDQLFFVSYAQLLCSGPETKFQESQDHHVSSNRVRIEETLKNFPEFSQAFQCPLKSPMNPEKKCIFW